VVAEAVGAALDEGDRELRLREARGRRRRRRRMWATGGGGIGGGGRGGGAEVAQEEEERCTRVEKGEQLGMLRQRHRWRCRNEREGVRRSHLLRTRCERMCGRGGRRRLRERSDASETHGTRTPIDRKVREDTGSGCRGGRNNRGAGGE
jgi:hypothetical protein